MNTKTTILVHFSLLCILLLSCGCSAQKQLKLYNGQEKPAQLLAIISPEKPLKIVRIDSNDHPTVAAEGTPVEIYASAALLPGRHTLSILYSGSDKGGMFKLNVKLEKGHGYKVKHNFHTANSPRGYLKGTVWVEDEKSGEIVSFNLKQYDM